VRVDLATESSELEGRARAYFAGYLARPRPGEAVATIIANPLTDSGGLWEDEDPEFHLFDGDSVVQRDFAARREGDRAVAWVAPDLDDAFHNLLRWFLPPLLLRAGAFLMHGAGAIRDGRGYAFFGESGAGKSTTMRLVASCDPHARVIGDDTIILRLESGRPRLEAAPLGCGYSWAAPPAASAPLQGLYSLSQSDRDGVQALEPAEGARLLLASAMGAQCEDALALAARFATILPRVSRLRFRREAAFWESCVLPPARRYNEVNLS
jgi:hypothetical protein